MSDFDPEEFLEQTGIETRLGGAPTIEPPLSSAGAGAQAEVLRQFGSLHAAISMIECAVRDNPSDDRLFDALDQALAVRMDDVRGALARLRERRDCRGAA